MEICFSQIYSIKHPVKHLIFNQIIIMKIFTEEFLKEIGFTLIKEEKSKFEPFHFYGSAKDKIGLTIISWSEEGHSCTYFGEKLKNNTSVGIKKDGGTRTVFNGYVFTQNDIKQLLNLTW